MYELIQAFHNKNDTCDDCIKVNKPKALVQNPLSPSELVGRRSLALSRAWPILRTSPGFSVFAWTTKLETSELSSSGVNFSDPHAWFECGNIKEKLDASRVIVWACARTITIKTRMYSVEYIESTYLRYLSGRTK